MPRLWTGISRCLANMLRGAALGFRPKAHRLSNHWPTASVHPVVLIINDEHILHIRHGSKYMCADIWNSQKPYEGCIMLHLTGESRGIKYLTKVTQPGRGWHITPRQSDLRLYFLKKMYTVMAKQGYLSTSLKYCLQGSQTFLDILLAWYKDVTMTWKIQLLWITWIAFTSYREDTHISGLLLHKAQSSA